MNAVGSSETTIVELCAILQLILDMVYTSETKQLPLLFQVIFYTTDKKCFLIMWLILQRVLKVLTSRCEKLSADELTRSLQLCLKMLCTIELNLVTWREDDDLEVDKSLVLISIIIISNFSTFTSDVNRNKFEHFCWKSSKSI